MPSSKAIRSAIFAGIRAANVEYEKWSNGWWVTDSGVEGLMVSSIAKRLSSRQNDRESLVMELAFRYILERAGATRPRGRPTRALRGGNLADIVLLDRDERPACVVEVKRMWDQTGCFRDLNRIRELVLQCNRRHDGSLRRGFLAVMLVETDATREMAEQGIREQAKQIERAIRDEFDSGGLRVKCFLGLVRFYPEKYRAKYDVDQWAHAGFCVELSSPNARAG